MDALSLSQAESVSQSNQIITYKKGYNLIDTHSYKRKNFTEVTN